MEERREQRCRADHVAGGHEHGVRVLASRGCARAWPGTRRRRPERRGGRHTDRRSGCRYGRRRWPTGSALRAGRGSRSGPGFGSSIVWASCSATDPSPGLRDHSRGRDDEQQRDRRGDHRAEHAATRRGRERQWTTLHRAVRATRPLGRPRPSTYSRPPGRAGSRPTLLRCAIVAAIARVDEFVLRQGPPVGAVFRHCEASSGSSPGGSGPRPPPRDGSGRDVDEPPAGGRRLVRLGKVARVPGRDLS